MASTATVRDLRNRFPRVRELVESEGEVLVTERGRPRYRLTLYTAGKRASAPPAKDYLARLKRHQPVPLRSAAAKALLDENRGGR
ncbi:MAG: type II toxin-antitoxin system Phd/YefM family antitoxin [Betaproteobacteria bacterium]|nr:type II toxin-antitoxin system Phd/YefM family antitoxin [Betaproteobacteria bacterium]